MSEAREAPADNFVSALVPALAACQAEWPVLQKTKEAKVRTASGPGYSYRYADLADVLDMVRPILAKHGLALVQRMYYSPGGKCVLRTELLHKSGESVNSDVVIDQPPSSPQQFGGALTYLRRYALVSLLGIQADDDRDGQDAAVQA
jgi:hypothetical protein